MACRDVYYPALPSVPHRSRDYQLTTNHWSVFFRFCPETVKQGVMTRLPFGTSRIPMHTCICNASQASHFLSHQSQSYDPFGPSLLTTRSSTHLKNSDATLGRVGPFILACTFCYTLSLLSFSGRVSFSIFLRFLYRRVLFTTCYSLLRVRGAYVLVGH
jgi:hypothetical protein